MTERFLLPTDFSDEAEVGVRAGAELARRLGAAVTLIHVWDPAAMSGPPHLLERPSEQDMLVAKAGQALQRRLEESRALAPAGVDVDTVLAEHHRTANAIAEHAEELDCSLVVVATHGRTGVGRLLLGSVTEKIVRLSRTPVLTVPVPSSTHG